MKSGRMILTLLFLFISGIAEAQLNRVTGVLVQEIDTVTSISITSTQKAKYSQFMLDGVGAIKKKLIIDVYGARHEIQTPSHDFPVGPVVNIRSSQFFENPATVRIVADLASNTSVRFEQQDNQLYIILTNYVILPPIKYITLNPEKEIPKEPVAVSTSSIQNIAVIPGDELVLPGKTIGEVTDAFRTFFGMNIILGKSVLREEVIDVQIANLKDPVQLFETILIANEYKWVKRENVLLVTGKEVLMDNEMEVRLFKLNYMDANDIIQNLQSLKTETTGQILAVSRRAIASSDLSIPSGGGGGAAGAGGAGGASSGGGSPLQGFEDFGQSEPAVQGQERSNIIMVYDRPSVIERIAKIIKELDVAVPQIHIAVKVVETTLGENEKWGINWTPIMEAVGAGGQPTGAGQQQGTAGGSNTREGQIIPGIPLISEGFTYATLTLNQFKGVLELLESKTDSKLLNQPSIVTLDNQQANIAVGKIIPVEVTQVGGGQQGGNSGGGAGGAGGGQSSGAITTIQQTPISIALSVLPRVNEDKYITMWVKPVVQELTGFTGRNGELPITSTRTATTSVRVRDGDVIILGGLIKEDNIQVHTRVKFLHKIPLLGRFFKHTRMETSRSELVIFITPSIVRERAVLSNNIK